jgi:hypothetical protein
MIRSTITVAVLLCVTTVAVAQSDAWTRYQESHRIAEGWRQKLREEEALRELKRQTWLMEQQDRRERERERNDGIGDRRKRYQ